MNVEPVAPEQAGSWAEIASVVHDLRNPLAAIHGSAEMLVRSGLSQPQVHRIARNMYSASVRMRELLEEFLDRSRSSERELCDVREFVGRAVERVAVSAEFQAVQITQTAPQGVAIAMERHRIHRVLVNLLVNALDMMPNGGTIRISAILEGRSVVIRVRDTGPGIPPEIRERLFEPFATAGKASGVGLGLAFSRQAVLDHGGEMWAEWPGSGATLAFRLPLSS